MTSLSFRHRLISGLVQVLVWALLVVVLFKPPSGGSVSLPVWLWGRQSLLLGLLLAVYYLNVGVLVPRWLLRGRAGRYAVVAAGLVLLVSVGSRYVNDWLFPPPDRTVGPRPEPSPGPPGSPPPGMGPHRPDQRFGRPGRRGPGPGAGDFDTVLALTATLVLAAGAGVGVAGKWQLDAETRRQLEEEKTTTELALLKAQINPHFFFNTLNNIYALTLLDADRARQALVQLSRLMRYVLYEAEPGATRLSQELGFLRDYVELMQLRLTPAATITLDVPAAPLPADPLLAPMLLLPFVENAFKHGISAEAPCRVSIRVAQPAPGVVELEVVNTRFAARAAPLEASNGIGLVNTRRRLTLLYPGRHELHLPAPDAPPGPEYRVWLRVVV